MNRPLKRIGVRNIWLKRHPDSLPCLFRLVVYIDGTLPIVFLDGVKHEAIKLDHGYAVHQWKRIRQ